MGWFPISSCCSAVAVAIVLSCVLVNVVSNKDSVAIPLPFGSVQSMKIAERFVGYEIAITTVTRPTSYLCTTLKSVLTSADGISVKLYHGGGYAYVQSQVQNCSKVAQNVEHIFPKESTRVLDLYYRLLSRRTPGNLLLVVEDDVLLDPEFGFLLNSVVKQIDDQSGSDSVFMLSLYNGIVQTDEAWCPTNKWCTGNLSALRASGIQSAAVKAVKDGWGFGTQAVLFRGEGMMRSLQQHFRDQRKSTTMLQDLFLKSFAADNDIPVWGVERSLCQHLGMLSSIFGTSKPHESLTFVPDVDHVLATLTSTDSSALDEGRYARASLASNAFGKRSDMLTVALCSKAVAISPLEPPRFRLNDSVEYGPWAHVYGELSSGYWLESSSPPRQVQTRARCCVEQGPRQCSISYWLRPGTTDSAVLGQVIAENEYGFITALQLPAPTTILDAGANCGIASVLFKSLFPKAVLVSVEASERNYIALRRNVAHFPRVKRVQAALWGVAGNLSLVKGSRHGKEWDNQIKATRAGDAEQVNLIQGITIPELLQRYRLKAFDFLKIDIEGSEKQVFLADDKGWLVTASFVAVEIHDDMQSGTKQVVFKSFEAVGTFCHLKSGEYDVWLNHATPLMFQYCLDRSAAGTDCCGNKL